MTASPFVVGVDPAHAGAVVLLVEEEEGVRAVASWTWRPVSRSGASVYRIASIGRLVSGDVRAVARTRPTLGMVGDLVTSEVHDATGGVSNVRLSAEGVHVRFVTAAISVEGSAGRILGPLERYADGFRAQRIKASEWRRILLRMGTFSGRESAKLAAARFVPPLVPGLDDLVGALRRDLGAEPFDPEHIFDAAGVARCRVLVDRMGDEWASRPQKRPSSKSGRRGSRARSAPGSAG